VPRGLGATSLPPSCFACCAAVPLMGAVNILLTERAPRCCTGRPRSRARGRLCRWTLLWARSGEGLCRHPARQKHLSLRGPGPVELRRAPQLHVPSLRRVHGGARRRLTPTVGLAVLAAVSSQSARVGSADRDRAPEGDCAGGHCRGHVLVNGGAVTQLAETILACEDAVADCVAERRSCTSRPCTCRCGGFMGGRGGDSPQQ
jgi:hypothetical protein